MASPILVIGATGKVGRRIFAKLAALGQPVRGASRRSDPAFDWENDATWLPVLAGAEVAFVSFVPDLAAKGATDAIRKFTTLAVASGLQRIVLLSGRGESAARRCEDIARSSGLGCTIVRASWFNQNFSEGHLLPAVQQGVIALPAGACLEPFVDVDDIADVAVAALLDSRHVGQIYEVTGPRLLSFTEAAAAISAASGRAVAYVPLSLAEFHAAMLPEVGAEHADFLHDLCEEVFDGRNQSLGDGVRRGLGRQPRDFGDFCVEIAAAGVWGAPVSA